jgi:hypothetical protein
MVLTPRDGNTTRAIPSSVASAVGLPLDQDERRGHAKGTIACRTHPSRGFRLVTLSGIWMLMPGIMMYGWRPDMIDGGMRGGWMWHHGLIHGVASPFWWPWFGPRYRHSFRAQHVFGCGWISCERAGDHKWRPGPGLAT